MLEGSSLMGGESSLMRGSIEGLTGLERRARGRSDAKLV